MGYDYSNYSPGDFGYGAGLGTTAEPTDYMDGPTDPYSAGAPADADRGNSGSSDLWNGSTPNPSSASGGVMSLVLVAVALGVGLVGLGSVMD